MFTVDTVKSLPSPTWNYAKMKFVVGRFNNDPYADIAIIHERATEVGADIHVFYGASSGITSSTTMTTQRNMPVADGWVWADMKIVSGDFTGDGLDDIAVGHKLGNGGIGLHVFTGGTGTAALANSNTDSSWKVLNGSTWLWDNARLAAGPFNENVNADLAIVYNNSGINVHVFNGGSEKFGNTTTMLRPLPATPDGWDWSKVKLAAGQFNSDSCADLALLHQVSSTDVGIGMHVLYGNPTPFQNVPTGIDTLTSANGYNWNNIKLTAGPFNDGIYGDIALFHLHNTNDADVHMLFGDVGYNMFAYRPTYWKTLPASVGWNWYDMTI